MLAQLRQNLDNIVTKPSKDESRRAMARHTFDKSLRAWDAADEYIINHVCEHVDLSTVEHIAIANDGFGALSCAMARLAPQATITVFTDSYAAVQGSREDSASLASLGNPCAATTVSPRDPLGSKINFFWI